MRSFHIDYSLSFLPGKWIHKSTDIEASTEEEARQRLRGDTAPIIQLEINSVEEQPR